MKTVSYVLATVRSEDFEYLYDEMGEELRFTSLSEARKEREEQDCPEAISILKETREEVKD